MKKNANITYKGGRMITSRVEIKEYCNNCPNFTSETYTQHLWGDSSTTPAGIEVVVQCKHRFHCEHLSKHLRKEE